MDIELWKSLPPDNNPEAMHWKLYRACGHDHEFLEGIYALFAFAAHYEQLYEAASSKFSFIILYKSITNLQYINLWKGHLLGMVKLSHGRLSNKSMEQQNPPDLKTMPIGSTRKMMDVLQIHQKSS